MKWISNVGIRLSNAQTHEQRAQSTDTYRMMRARAKYRFKSLMISKTHWSLVELVRARTHTRYTYHSWPAEEQKTNSKCANVRLIISDLNIFMLDMARYACTKRRRRIRWYTFRKGICVCVRAHVHDQRMNRCVRLHGIELVALHHCVGRLYSSRAKCMRTSTTFRVGIDNGAQHSIWTDDNDREAEAKKSMKSVNDGRADAICGQNKKLVNRNEDFMSISSCIMRTSGWNWFVGCKCGPAKCQLLYHQLILLWFLKHWMQRHFGLFTSAVRLFTVTRHAMGCLFTSGYGEMVNFVTSKDTTR